MKTLVCEPDPKNITLIFRPMIQFIDEIEKALGCTAGYKINKQKNKTNIGQFFFLKFKNNFLKFKMLSNLVFVIVKESMYFC